MPGYSPSVAGKHGRFVSGRSVLSATVLSANDSTIVVLVDGTETRAVLLDSDGWEFEEGDDFESPEDAGYRRAVENARWLADARDEYGGPRTVQSANDYQALNDTDQRIHDQVTSARHIADILDGKNDGSGWLPSWRWDDWCDRQS